MLVYTRRDFFVKGPAVQKVQKVHCGFSIFGSSGLRAYPRFMLDLLAGNCRGSGRIRPVVTYYPRVGSTGSEGCMADSDPAPLYSPLGLGCAFAPRAIPLPLLVSGSLASGSRSRRGSG